MGEVGTTLPRGEKLWAVEEAKPYMPREVPGSWEDILSKIFDLDTSLSPKSHFRHLHNF